mgnify:CR=1 FL=1
MINYQVGEQSILVLGSKYKVSSIDFLNSEGVKKIRIQESGFKMNREF